MARFSKYEFGHGWPEDKSNFDKEAATQARRERILKEQDELRYKHPRVILWFKRVMGTLPPEN